MPNIKNINININTTPNTHYLDVNGKALPVHQVWTECKHTNTVTLTVIDPKGGGGERSVYKGTRLNRGGLLHSEVYWPGTHNLRLVMDFSVGKRKEYSEKGVLLREVSLWGTVMEWDENGGRREKTEYDSHTGRTFTMRLNKSGQWTKVDKTAEAKTPKAKPAATVRFGGDRTISQGIQYLIGDKEVTAAEYTAWLRKESAAKRKRKPKAKTEFDPIPCHRACW